MGPLRIELRSNRYERLALTIELWASRGLPAAGVFFVFIDLSIGANEITEAAEIGVEDLEEVLVVARHHVLSDLGDHLIGPAQLLAEASSLAHQTERITRRARDIDLAIAAATEFGFVEK